MSSGNFRDWAVDLFIDAADAVGKRAKATQGRISKTHGLRRAAVQARYYAEVGLMGAALLPAIAINFTRSKIGPHPR
jgi:hypothetical protein